MTVECDHVFMSVGQSILWGDLLKNEKVELGRGNGAVADAVTYQTAQPDVFVGGDVYTGPKFAIDAIAAGRKRRVHSPLCAASQQSDYRTKPQTVCGT